MTVQLYKSDLYTRCVGDYAAVHTKNSDAEIIRNSGTHPADSGTTSNPQFTYGSGEIDLQVS